MKPGYERARVLITVKTYPNPSAKYEETVCVAGVRLDGEKPEWIRLYPVRFRSVDEGAQFDKYEVIEVHVTPHGSTDPRVESHRPDQQTVVHLDRIDTDRGTWRRRRDLLGELPGMTTTCDLRRDAVSGRMSDPARSLGMIKPHVTDVSVSEGRPWDAGQLRKIADASQPTLFGPGLRPLEPMPYNVHYEYTCEADGCDGHRQKVLDWELGQAGRKWKREYGDLAIEEIRRKWADQMTASDRDLYFFIGNQHQHRGSFSVLGTWWPKQQAEDRQLGLF
ncbi:hypothetical protein AAFP35_16885 [Gordonia sp. CPCC 206044]|uniref:hypothetical protein n=1 Tax=Gordonia sp. CPCC 206044 TaxID=3140793 RepID=UPI003AF3E274